MTFEDVGCTGSLAGVTGIGRYACPAHTGSLDVDIPSIGMPRLTGSIPPGVIPCGIELVSLSKSVNALGQLLPVFRLVVAACTYQTVPASSWAAAGSVTRMAGITHSKAKYRMVASLLEVRYLSLLG